VAAGILLSRLSGFARSRVFAHYFGLRADEAEAFNAAFRIPNLLQNLFGETALSGSFIPVYSGLISRGNPREADRVAGAVAALVGLITAALVLAGVLAAPILVGIIAPGFKGSLRDLTINIVRILFPGAGLLVMSAWCLGVLNSHFKFLLSYTAPVLWNAAMIGALLFYGTAPLPDLVIYLAWGSVVGSALQFAVQVPVVWRVAPHLKFALDTASENVRLIARNFVPVFIGRGVVQLSAYIDTVLASYLPGAMTGLANAQLLYTLPVSLFGMSVSAAELPAMAGAIGADPAAIQTVRRRLEAGLRQITFFVVPSTVAFLALGDVAAAAVFQTGRFDHADALFVWAILAGSSVGLLPSTMGRLYASTCYAFGDTRRPMRFALVRLGLAAGLGYIFAILIPTRLGLPAVWGAAGLTAASGMAGWVEAMLLRRTVSARIGQPRLGASFLARLWAAAAGAAGAAWLVKTAIPPMHPVLAGVCVLGVYGALFLGLTALLGVPETSSAIARIRRLGKREGGQ
jgi:putative peptidoglycan lipid II flippase